MMKDFRIQVILFLLLAGLTHSQSVQAQGTHDDERMNQFLVGMTGAGSLQPAWYYNLFHKSYQSDATLSNKSILSAEMKHILMGEEPDAESIDSALVARAKVEALKVADRELDVAWQSEGPKIRKRLDSYKSLIMKITVLGGTMEDYQRFEMDYNKLTCAVRAVQDSYQDNSLRTREYSAIYSDILKSELVLVAFLKDVRYKKKAREDYEASKNDSAVHSRFRSCAVTAHEKWKNAFILASRTN